MAGSPARRWIGRSAGSWPTPRIRDKIRGIVADLITGGAVLE
jgi:hypothetical protein